MTMLTCSRCGQRYYGPRAPVSTCALCHAPLQEPDWHTHGRRAGMVPLPVLNTPQPGASASDWMKPVTR